MTITTVTSREFNQDVSKIKRASLHGPVFITDRGRAAHVLLTIKDYQKLTEENKRLKKENEMFRSHWIRKYKNIILIYN